MNFNSDELNFLVYRYLQESGFQHSAFTFGLESNIASTNINGTFVPAGALINIIQKGIFYTEAEICVGDDDIDQHLNENLSLIDAVTPQVITTQQNRRRRRNNRNTNNNETKVEEVAAMTSAATSSNTLTQSGCIEIPSSISTVLTGHLSEAFMCSWNPTSDLLLSGSGDGTARLWDVSDCVFTSPPLILSHVIKLTGNRKPRNRDVTAIDWRFDGKLICTGSYDGYARIWHRDGRISRVIGQQRGPIFAIKWNKKGNYIVSVGIDSDTYIWDVNCSTYNRKLKCHTSPVLDVDWRTNDCFATCSVDQMIHVWSLDNDKPIKTFKGHTNEINAVKWDPQGNLLASCSDDCTVKIWSMNQDTCVHDLHGHTKEIYTMKWSQSGPGTMNPNMNLVLATGSYDSTIIMWDVERGVQTRSLLNHTEPVYSIAFSPNGKFLASGSFDKHINVWSVQDGKLAYRFRASDGIFEVDWNHTGEKISASAANGKVYVLDLRKI